MFRFEMNVVMEQINVVSIVIIGASFELKLQQVTLQLNFLSSQRG